MIFHLFWGDANSFQLYEHPMGRMLIPKKVQVVF